MDSKKEKILSTATRLFSERGFENTSVSQIVKEADVSKGLIYHHFKDKNDLLREIIKGTTHKMFEISSPTEETDEPKQSLVQIIEQVFYQLEHEKEFFQFNLNITFQPALKSILADLLKERSSFLFDSLHTIFTKMGTDDPSLSTYILISEIDGIALSYLSIFEDYPITEMKKQLLSKYTN